MLNTIKAKLGSAFAYLSDSGHRRFVAMIVALAATHLAGVATDSGSVANVIEIVIGGLGGIWTNTPAGNQ